MKAAVIYAHGGSGSIKLEPDFPDPSPGADDVVMRVRDLTQCGKVVVLP